MNARQKAKKYKKLAQEYKDKAVMFDRMQRALYFERLRHKMNIEPIKFQIRVPYFYGKEATEEIYKRQLAKEISNFLLDNDLVVAEWEDNNVEQARIYTGILKVVRE